MFLFVNGWKYKTCLVLRSCSPSQQESQWDYKDLPITMMSSQQCPYTKNSNSCEWKGNKLHIRQNYVNRLANLHLTTRPANKASRSNFSIMYYGSFQLSGA